MVQAVPREEGNGRAGVLQDLDRRRWLSPGRRRVQLGNGRVPFERLEARAAYDGDMDRPCGAVSYEWLAGGVRDADARGNSLRSKWSGRGAIAGSRSLRRTSPTLYGQDLRLCGTTTGQACTQSDCLVGKPLAEASESCAIPKHPS